MKACLHFLLLELNLELDVVMGDVVCCLEKNLSISKTGLFKLSAGAHSNASSAHVRSQAGPEMTRKQQLYLLDAEVCKQTQGHILDGQMPIICLLFLSVCMIHFES